MSNEEFENKVNYSSRIHLSYAFGSFFDDFIMTAFSMRVYSFYETELLLPPVMVSLAITLYGIWNMLNDPLAGYISDIPFRFTEKRGKRYTWFIIASFPTGVIYLLIFFPPGNNPVTHFFWLLMFICLYDTFFSFWNTNWMAIFPFKFRSQKERTKVAGFQTFLSQLGLALGMLIPPLFIEYGVNKTYLNAALFVMIVVFAAIILMIPGMKEKARTENEIQKARISIETESQNQNYFETIKYALKQRNMRAYLIAYLGQMVMMTVMLASIPYIVKYLLNGEGFLETLISGAVLVGGVFSVPLWIKVGRTYGNRIGYLCGTGLTSISLVILFFITNSVGIIICALLIGFTMGATWSLMYPTFSDVIDDLVIKMGKRNEGIFYGFRTFIGRFSIVIQAIVFGTVHTITNFNPELSIQSASALWGIRFHTAIIPALFYFFGFLAMWKIYDLTPEKAQKNKKILHDLGL
jgi:GPH family glycoside/pentoside/hexuronide:cation symporter